MIHIDVREQLPFELSRFLARPGGRQLIRYMIAGFCITQFAALIYSSLAVYAHVNPLQANVVSTGCGVCSGYLAHNYWSFAAGTAKGEFGKAARFGATTLVAFLFNSFWVWLLVSRMHLSAVAPVPIMMFVTPWVSFLANRYWVFRPVERRR
jgi:putative flippase GtrA